MTGLCLLAALTLVLAGPSKPGRIARWRLTVSVAGRLPKARFQPASGNVFSASTGRAGTTTTTTATADGARRLASISAVGVAVACVACFAAPGILFALVLGPAVFMGTRKLAGRPAGVIRAESESLPGLLDLLGTAVRSGAALPTALTCVAAAASGAPRVALGRTAALLQLGATPSEAWKPLRNDPQLGPLAAVAVRSADSGIRFADGLTRQAQACRADLQTADATRAARVGVAALLPVGLCFLPAFVCLGVVPIVAGVAGTAFGGLTP